mmetsp:Transcript_4066/g.7413  ORF Transcript_4066/g.7413 Transcript_4066/m.7413 type:complete len:172 (+) Transcript_4066:27-542(+)|eukprot:CAMPEP_0184695928 /NCGR_PEP_ID=MMETSP0313-20130426/3389_1 /TAXON_ID=2792 /ORGANISM="Porphyridium aerugineum, Strain SAG 1380-2" /LENGTH=171 /DNA_ID=CAMNT_0027154455 /DNA_START=71 /DNA_END=586 /DNA_ORIENTATION=-
MAVDNPNPEIKHICHRESVQLQNAEVPLRKRIFEIIRDIRDPEHPHTLEELSVLDEDSVVVTDPDLPACRTYGLVHVSFTPTVPHCSLASLIGLCIRTKIKQSDILPPGYKLDVSVVEGTHSTDKEITKQLNDKERVSAALENAKLREMVRECIEYDASSYSQQDVISSMG